MIVWHLDRLYRKPRELEQLLDLLDARPIRVESVQGGSFDLNRHEGRLFARQLVAFANYESAHKGARVARAQQHRARRGLLHGGTHYGYLADGTLHPTQGQVLRRIVDDFLTGLSVSAIARELTDIGIPSPAGNAQWNAQTLTSVLNSNRLHRRNGDHDGTWERLVTPDESALIRAIQIAPRRDATRSSRALLSAMARCGNCGNRLVSAVTRHGRRLYRCRASPGSCGAVAISQAQLDHTVVSRLRFACQARAAPETPLAHPDRIHEALCAAVRSLSLLAEKYGSAELARTAFLAQRAHPTKVIDEQAAELIRHLRFRLLDRHPEIIQTLDGHSIGRRRAVMEAFFREILVRPREAGDGEEQITMTARD